VRNSIQFELKKASFSVAVLAQSISLTVIGVVQAKDYWDIESDDVIC